MLPSIHLIFSFLISIILALCGWDYLQLILFFLTAFFVDIDHFFYFIYKKKSLNLFQAYNHFYHLNEILKKEKKKKTFLMIFHTIELLILFFILSFFNYELFFPLFLGLVSHYILDLIALFLHKEKRYKRAFSLIYYLYRKE